MAYAHLPLWEVGIYSFVSFTGQARNYLGFHPIHVTESVDAGIADKRARQVNAGNDARGSGPVRGQDVAPPVCECTFAGFRKCNPTTFHGTEGAAKLQRWFEKTESVFRISECAEGKKRFNELALMCPRIVEPERVIVDAYIRGLTDNIKDEVTSSNAANLNEAVRMAHKLMEQKLQARDEKSLEVKKRNHTMNRCPKKVKQEEVEKVHGRAYAIKDTESKGLNVVTSMFLLNHYYAFVLFDSGSDKSFVDTRFSFMLNIDLVKIRASCNTPNMGRSKI
nr:hypothetical protein [Tanacetum cinerariifolium]